MDIDKLFLHRDRVAAYKPQQFQTLREDVGVVAPILFLLNPDALRTSEALTITKLADVTFDLYVVHDATSSLAAYVIDTKHPATTRTYVNGVVISQSAALPPGRGITVKYSFDEFQVVANEASSVVVFCRNLATHQAT